MNEEDVSQRIVSMSPFRCRMWRLHERAEEYLTEESCRAEISSFEKHGQLIPVLGRRLQSDPTHDVELIVGARRLFVARHLNVPLQLELREISDREGVIVMDIENRLRQDVSPYERGASYLRWLHDSLFSSQYDIARTLKISTSQVSRLIKIARLPAIILSVFETPTKIRETWGLELSAALEDSKRRDRVLRKARALGRGSARPSAEEAYRQLLAAAESGHKVRVKNHKDVVLNDEGKPLFRIRYGRTSVALLLPMQLMSEKCLQEIREAVGTALSRQATMRSLAGVAVTDNTGSRGKGAMYAI